MTHPSNPTSASAVVGQRLAFGAGPGRLAGLAKELTVPVLLLAASAYLLVGIVTMRVPDGTAFPGPRFFPGLIAAALAVLATLLVVRVVRQRRAAEAEAADAVARAVLLDDEAAVREPAEPEPAARAVRVDVRSLAWVVLSFAGFALLLDVLGWIVAAGLLFVGVARGLGAAGWLRPLLVGLTVSSLSYIAFDMLLELSLPSGIIGWGF
ncbi:MULTISPECIES: tripartite tricarboxylate transporter TctB family protein [unclassified Agrococcus]|uniref:tripartite tricarboxylate transporter TctB family protein n=1 Tax=unclassified Agrococcus TaxID=2615065 RepID=UPI003613C9A8